jgi:hypothetical protein
MADDFVGHDFQAKTFPFQQPVGFPLTSFTGVPWGQAIVDEAWASQAIGAGDTGTINLDIEVPNDYVSLLRSFTLSATSQSNIRWIDGIVGLAYQQPGGPYKTTTSSLPEKEYLWWNLSPGYGTNVRDRFSTTTRFKNFDITMDQTDHRQETLRLSDPSGVPLWLPPGTASLKERAMIVYLVNNTANSAANDFRLNVVFDLYTQEQAYASGVMSSPRVFT